MNILLVCDTPLDYSEVGYKIQNLAMELLKKEHTVTVISFEYIENNQYPFNTVNILFNSNKIPFEIPVYEKCSYSETLFHYLSSNEIKIIIKIINNEIDSLLKKYKFDLVYYAHIMPLLLFADHHKIPTCSSAEIDEINMINEIGYPDFVHLSPKNLKYIYFDKYSRDVIEQTINPGNSKQYKWGGIYNHSIYRLHEDKKFEEILEYYNIDINKPSVILQDINLTDNEIEMFIDVAKIFSIFKKNIGFKIVKKEVEKLEINENIPNLEVIYCENRFHKSIIYNNASLAVIPSLKPIFITSIFEIIASNLPVISFPFDSLKSLALLPYAIPLTDVNIADITEVIYKNIDFKNRNKIPVKEIKMFSYSVNFGELLNIFEKIIDEY